MCYSCFGAHGTGFLSKNAANPCRHSSVSRGSALARASSSVGTACREHRRSNSFVVASAPGPPSASDRHHPSAVP